MTKDLYSPMVEERIGNKIANPVVALMKECLNGLLMKIC